MKTSKKNSIVFLLLAGLAFFAQSCSAGFKKKMEVAATLKENLGAKSVTVGYTTKTDSDKGKRVMTTLTFSGINPDGWDELGVFIASDLTAYRFVQQMSPQEISGETHVQVILEMEDKMTYTNEYLIKELQQSKAFVEVTDQAVEACKNQDNQKLHELCDQSYLPDSVMGSIYHVNAYNDSLYHGKTRKPELKGIRYANGEEDPNLELFSALYLEKHPGIITRYDINVDRKTKKVVYVSVNTQPQGD